MMNKYINAFLLTSISSLPLFGSDCRCPTADPCAKCAQIWPTRGPDWIITPGAGPCVSHGWDAYITAEFLYWIAREDHLRFAIFEPADGDGKILDPDWSFEPGFKVGVGILYDHDSWDLYVNYTWYQVDDTKETKTVEDPQTQRIRPIGDSDAFAGISQPILFVSGEWELKFNVLDAELGRNFFISRYLKLRPHFGLKGTWQDQDFLILAQNPTLQSEDKHSLHYWGVGIRTGLDSSWHFNPCFSLVGEVAVSGLWERFEVKRKSQSISLVGENSFIALDIENTFSSLHPVLELLLGLRYETWFCCDRYHFGLEAGWELQWWGEQNEFLNLTTGSECGSLNLNGFTLKFRLDF